MGQIKTGISGSGGGRGSSANLNNAGAASADLTALLAKQSLQKSQEIIAALIKAQKSPSGTTSDNKTVINGLQLPSSPLNANQLPGLVPYYNTQNPSPGLIPANGSVPVPGTWSGIGPKTAVISGESVVQQPGLQQSSTAGANNNPASATVTINQTQQSAYLYWSSFNVGANTTVNFTQSGNNGLPGTWVAFNKVMTPNNPAHIFGTIKSEGQVYILNQNGILFHGGSVINVHSLVASTLPINKFYSGDPLSGVSSGYGLANNVGDQFLFSSLNLSQSRTKNDQFNPGNIAASQIGGVTVESGASITTSVSNDGSGGRVVLVGPSVANNGSIFTPNGQTILAAGLQVALIPHPTSDPSLRGLDAVVGQVADSGGGSVDGFGNQVGTVENNGVIKIPVGEAMLAGRTILQNGVIDSTTTVALNGRIDLISSFNAVINPSSTIGQPYYYDGTRSGNAGTTGQVTIGADSLMRIMPDDSGGSITGPLPLPSLISIVGKNVKMESGAVILAPGASINDANPAYGTQSAAWQSAQSAQLPSGISIQAGDWFSANLSSFFLFGSSGGAPLGDVNIESGTLISAAGTTGAQIDSSQYIQTVQLRAAELANSPLQKTSVVRAKNITVDLRISGTYNGTSWVGTPLGDLTGYANLIQRGIRQLTDSGGSISVQAGNSVSIANGSVIDVSGGWIQYLGGNFATSRLITSSGSVVSIDKATPDLIYAGIIKTPSSDYQASYYSGGAGGSLLIQSPALTLLGNLRGTTVNGPLQIPGISSLNSVTTPSSLNLQIFNSTLAAGSLVFDSPYHPKVVFSSLPVSPGQISIDPLIFGSSGFGSLTVSNHDGAILLGNGTSINLGPKGKLNLTGSSISLDGEVLAPGGSISLTAFGVSYPEMAALPPGSTLTQVDAGSGVITLGENASLSTSGLVTMFPSVTDDASESTINGGSVSIKAYSVLLKTGSTVDVSGGALMLTPVSKTTYGNAGKISISAQQDPKYPTIQKGALELESHLNGYAGIGASAGTLSLAFQAIQIGGISSPNGAVVLSPTFFNEGGFSSFSLSGTGIQNDDFYNDETPAILIKSGSVIHPQVKSSILSVAGLEPYLLPDFLRPAASITLNASQLADGLGKVMVRGGINLESGSSLVLDPQAKFSSPLSTIPTWNLGSLSITANFVTASGLISVPGGKILISSAGNLIGNGSSVGAQPTLVVGGQISTAGQLCLIPDQLGLGRLVGGVASGGSISMNGNILTLPGSILDVSGAAGNLFLNQNKAITSVDSDAGSITLNGSNELIVQGNLKGAAGGRSATGGSLKLSSGRYYDLTDVSDTHDITFVVTQDPNDIPSLIASPPVPGSSGMGYVAANTIMRGNFDALNLGGNILFSGDVNLTLPGSITIASGGIVQSSSQVTLTASYVNIGKTFNNPLDASLSQGQLLNPLGTYKAPTGGMGFLSVVSKNMDVGTLLLMGMKKAVFSAPGGMIRGDGTLDIAGDIVLEAAQVSPLTETSFQVDAYPHDAVTGLYNSLSANGSITIVQSGSRLPLPLSAAGSISLYASSVVQGGTLVAPFGIINLGWNGTESSPIDPLTGAGTVGGVIASVPAANSTEPLSPPLLLKKDSYTSVSGLDTVAEKGISVPYGIILNGSQWIDPAGNNITATGPLIQSLSSMGISFSPKGINLSASSITQDSGATIDLRGGGDLTAFEWISGNGGTVDITAPSSGSFAVLPGYNPSLFPRSSFSRASQSGGDPGYVSTSLSIGDVITLAGGGKLPAGTYTILPSRYALIPGAFLITPTGKVSEYGDVSIFNPDGTMLQSGTVFNGLNDSRSAPVLQSLFMVNSPSVITARAQYTIFTASSFLPTIQSSTPVGDAAGLLFDASTALNLSGNVKGSGASGCRGAIVSLSSGRPFLIGGETAPAVGGSINLSSAVLSSWNAGTLLIGGTENVTSSGITIKATPGNTSVTVDNNGDPLSVEDLILVSQSGIFVNTGSVIKSSGSDIAPAITVSGNGAMLRVSADPTATVSRTSSTSLVDGYNVGNATITGGSVTLDSSYSGSISPDAVISAKVINLDAVSVGVNLNSPTDTWTLAGSLNLNARNLTSLSQANALNVSSGSTVTFHGTGTFGSTGLKSLSIHAGEILDTDTSHNVVTIEAQQILLENAGRASDSSSGNPAAGSGELDFLGNTLSLGSGYLSIGGFSSVRASLHSEIEGVATPDTSTLGNATPLPGMLAVGGSLVLSAPLITGASCSTTIKALGGDLILNSPTPGFFDQALVPASGGRFVFKGDSVSIDAPIVAHSGSVSIEATGTADGDRDVTVSSTIDVSGPSGNLSVQVFDAMQPYPGGTISITSGHGSIDASKATLNLNGSTVGGNAGTLSIFAANGTLILPTISPASSSQTYAISANAANGCLTGIFNAVLGSYEDIVIPGGVLLTGTDPIHVSNLTSLEQDLSAAGFKYSQNIRITTGDVLLASSATAAASSYTLTADGSGFTGGSILIAGAIDSSGKTSGTITIAAGANLTLAPTAILSVHGDVLNNAGQGGLINLMAGANSSLASAAILINSDPQAVNATQLTLTGLLDLQPGSKLNLGVGLGGSADVSAGVLHLSTPQNSSGTGVQIAEISSLIHGASQIDVEGVFTLDAATPDPTGFNGKMYDWQNNNFNSSGIPLIDGLMTTALMEASNYASYINEHNPYASSAYASLIHFTPGIQIINSLGSLELSSDLDLSTARYGTQLPILNTDGRTTGNTVGQDSGYLTIRARGDVFLNGSISDGFGDSINSAGSVVQDQNGLPQLYLAPLIPLVQGIDGVPKSQTSWSYVIAAGADLSAANPLSVIPTASANQGSVKLGIVTANANIDLNPSSSGPITEDSITGKYQVIRTGAGNIRISASQDIQLLNQFATIYTAGALAPDQFLSGMFDQPMAIADSLNNQNMDNIGAVQSSQKYPAQFSRGGGNVSLFAGNNISDLQAVQDSNPSNRGNPLVNDDSSLTMIDDSTRELPINWISRRGALAADGSWIKFGSGEVASTAWWVNFSNFFEGIGALGGGNVSIIAGNNINNIDAVIPTNLRLTYNTIKTPAGGEYLSTIASAAGISTVQLAQFNNLNLSRGDKYIAAGTIIKLPSSPSTAQSIELGGGDLTVSSGGNLNAGVYYVEKGSGVITVGGSIITNPTREVNGSPLIDLSDPSIGTTPTSPNDWLPTSFFLGGNSSMKITAGGSMEIGPVGNVFLQAPGIQNDVQDKTYFSSYGQSSSFMALTLGGNLTFKTALTTLYSGPSFAQWLSTTSGASTVGSYQPWTQLSEVNPSGTSQLSNLLPAVVTLSAPLGGIALQGDLVLTPSGSGGLSLTAKDDVSGLYMTASGYSWSTSMINVSDARPSDLPGSLIPSTWAPDSQYIWNYPNINNNPFIINSFKTYSGLLTSAANALKETASYSGSQSLLQYKVIRHDPGLHRNDPNPVRIYSSIGDITSITLYSPEVTRLLAGNSITDVEIVIQNNLPDDVSVVSAGHLIQPFDNQTTQRSQALQNLGSQAPPLPLQGDIQISGPGTLEVLSGGTINLGDGDQAANGTGAGITSIGNNRNPGLPFDGANLVVASGVNFWQGLSGGVFNSSSLISLAANLSDSASYYSELLTTLKQGGYDNVASDLANVGSLSAIDGSSLSGDEKARIALGLFYIILRDSGRDRSNPDSKSFGSYKDGLAAIKKLFPSNGSEADITLNSKNILTTSGGSISLLAPNGGVTLSPYAIGSILSPPGIITQHGGAINIFTDQNVSLGVGRIFTLRGGDITIWSSRGDIAAGASSKTVAAAPPTRVIIDSLSAAVDTDLAGLATGGGIGTLQTVKGVAPSNVDLIAVSGVIDAGDAGIRSSGNLNLAATKILNADNIVVSGTSVGTPSSAPATAPPPAAPPATAPPAAASAAAANNSAAETASKNNAAAQNDESPSIYSIDILGYGGGDEDEDKKKAADATVAPIQASL